MIRGVAATPAARVVVIHPERRAQRVLARLARSTLCRIDVLAEVPAAADACADAIVIVDAKLACAQPALRERAARAWIAVPGEGLEAASPDAVAVLLAAGWDHVIAHPMPLLAEELLATTQKLLRDECFGLDKYMAWGASISSFALDNALERADAVALLARELVPVGLPERISSLVGVIADELLANAIYAAPVDETGARFRARESREASRALVGRDVVTLRWATDARYLAIEVRDRWGSLDPIPIGRRLAASKNHARPEDGMGLPLAYACANQLVLGVAPAQLTEIVALLDVRYKPTDLARNASFHVFTTTSAPS
ncbi:MAG TPA: ATP-binding protein [Kofleriaceae bacterium]|nr:ATP-binding protein [Kofleriaceae bacterium]